MSFRYKLMAVIQGNLNGGMCCCGHLAIAYGGKLL